MLGFARLCSALCGFAWLCLALLGYAWLCSALLGFAQLRFAQLGFARLCLTLLGFCSTISCNFRTFGRKVSFLCVCVPKMVCFALNSYNIGSVLFDHWKACVHLLLNYKKTIASLRLTYRGLSKKVTLRLLSPLQNKIELFTQTVGII